MLLGGIMKKILTNILSLIIFFCCFSFLGCKDNEREIYLEVKDEYGNTYTIKKQESITLEYDTDTTRYIMIWAQAYYEDNGEPYDKKPRKTFTETAVWQDRPGEYQLVQDYGGKKKFYATVKVNEVRPLPTLRFIGGENCVSFIENEKYVYRYNGEANFPVLKMFYQYEELLFTLDKLDYMIYNGEEFVELENASIMAKEVGIYRFRYFVSPYSLFPFELRKTFRKIEGEIIIEIIE